MADFQFTGIEKSFTKGVPILSGLDLTVKSGELFFLLGPSGCGKSTLLRIAAGLYDPDKGDVLLDGKSILGLPPEKRNTPMVFQNYALWPHMNVFENVAFGLRARKESNAKIREKVGQVLESVRMSEYADRKVTALSGGQQQRVALARALVLEPSVLLLDEPLSNLDAKLRDVMRSEIRNICKSRGLTAIYVTHDRREALGMADRIAVMKNGKFCQIGTPREIYQHPVNHFTASFLGDANFLSGRCLGKEGKYYVFETVCGNMLASADFFAENGKEYDLMFRPEAVKMDVPPDQENSFTAEVKESMYLGELTQMTLECGTFRFDAGEQAAPERNTGMLFSVAIPPEHLICLEKTED